MKNIFLFSLLILVVSCNNTVVNKVEVIKAEAAGDQNLFFSEFVKEIELVPLDNKMEAFLSDSPELEVHDNEYFIFNRRFSLNGASPSENTLLKFDASGKLIQYIGSNGRGPREYINVQNFCIYKDTIYIFSSPDFVINKFKPTGEFIEKKTIPCKTFMQALKFGDKYLLYLNLRNGIRDERMVVVNEQGKETAAYLPIKAKICPFFENNCLTMKHNDEVAIREFYNDTVYTYNTEHGVVPSLVLDFAEKSVPKKEYVESEGSDKDMVIYFKQPSASIYKYFEGDKFLFFEIFDNTGNITDHKFLYAAKNKKSGIIRWFDFEKDNHFLKNSFQFLEGDKFYCLVYPLHFDTMTDSFKRLIKNPEVLEKITPEDNRVLLKITLK
ncbi:MAG: 6-bladed beta-propeller [Bacteroidales bacterium]|jgi:hypothetical protein